MNAWSPKGESAHNEPEGFFGKKGFCEKAVEGTGDKRTMRTYTMTLTQRITQVLQQRKIMQEQLQDRRKLSRARMEAICEKPASSDSRVIIFDGARRA